MFIIQDVMRKHRRPVLWVILVLMVGPFVLWGGYSGVNWGKGENAGMAQGMIVNSGEATVTAEAFRQAMYQERARLAQFGQEPTFEEMLSNGTALRVLESLVSRELIAKEAAKQGYDFDQRYLTERMKKLPDFQDQNGKFDPRAWNSVVQRHDVNWNAIYASIREQISRELYVERLMASGRVLESNLKRQFEEEHTKLSLKYIEVQPKIEPTEEQIQAAYDEDPHAYDLPEKRKADFVAISITPPKPPLADELVKRARAGEDFVQLVREYSQGDTKDNDGDLGWVTESLVLPDYQKVLFTLGQGEVSDAVEGPAGYYIYKVEEERASELSGQRDVRAREIVLHTELPADELTARKEKAEAVDAKAKETGDLAAAASEFGLEVHQTDLFSKDSLAIESVPADDTRLFRANLSLVGDGEISGVVSARRNLYVAKVVELEPAEPQPLEAVRETVTQKAIATIRRSPEYAKQVDDLVKQIESQAKSLSDIPALFPQLDAAVQTAPEFSVGDWKFGSGPPWNPRDVLLAVTDKEAGSIAGPVKDFLGETYFVEVISKTPPDEKAWKEEWPEAEKNMRRVVGENARQARLEDRLTEMRERSPYPVNQQAFMQALGLNQGEEGNGAPERALEETGPTALDGLPTGDSVAGSSATPEEAPATTESTPVPEAAATGEAAPSAAAEPAPTETAPTQ